MVTVDRIAGQSNGRSSDFRGLSTNTKPTKATGKEVENGSTYFEMDTSKVFMYDEENDTWHEI